AAAFTSDAKARWASEWLQWPGFGKFWTQLVRSLMCKSEQTSFQVSTSETGNRLTLKIDAVAPDGSFRNELPLTVNCIDANGATKTQAAQQDAPGNYSATFDLPEQGTSIFSISSGQENDSYVFGYTCSYPKEFLTNETNEPLLRSLAEIGHGEFSPRPADVFAPPQTPVAHRLDLTPWLLGAALVLFPFDIWLRRRSWR